jgi:hypothetical protein
LNRGVEVARRKFVRHMLCRCFGTNKVPDYTLDIRAGRTYLLLWEALFVVLYVVYRPQSVGGDFAEEWTAICFHICFLEHGLCTFTTRKLIQSRRSFVHASIVRFYGSLYRKWKEKASEGCCSEMI